MARAKRSASLSVLAIVETENLFVNVAIKMKWLNSNVGSAQGPLKKRPEVFQPVRVNAATDVGFRMVHNVMHEAGMQMFVSNCIIGVDRGAVFHIAQNFVLQSLALDVRHYRSANLTKFTVKHSLHNRLALELLTKLVNANSTRSCACS